MVSLIVKLYTILVAILVLNIVTIRADDSCIIKEFIQVAEIVSKCKNIVVSNLSVPGGQQLVLKLTDGSTLSFRDIIKFGFYEWEGPLVAISGRNINVLGQQVPGGQLLNLSLSDGASLTFRGTIKFGFYEWEGPLVAISGRNIDVFGEKGSVLDGQGSLWWDGQGGWSNLTKPKFIKIEAINAVFDGINILNTPISCASIKNSENVTIRNWKIDNLSGDEGVASGSKFGHNTDGFGVDSSTNILIEDTVVYNQDDCVVFNSGQNITVRNVFCHGGHGISVSANEAPLQDVVVENSIITMSSNGIHIKTHVDSGKGLIKNVLYRNITLLDCTFYGISVEQNYKNLPAGQPQDGPPKNNIPIHNLTMINIYGNVLSGAVPVYILCAKEGCFDWKWEGISIYGALSDNCTNYIPEGYNCGVRI